MSNENAKVQVNIKSGEGFDATLVNVYAENEWELTQLLDAVIQHAPQIAAAKGAVQVAHGIEVKSAQAQQAPPQQQQEGWQNQSATPPPFVQNNGQAQYSQPDNSGGPLCKHGPMEWKDFTSKAGNHVKGFFCPSTNRSDQCAPQYRK